MGKKDKKAGKGAAGVDIPWKQIDKDPVSFLVAPETSETFFAECWERAPRVFKATPARAALARRLTTLPTLLAWLKELEAEGGASPLLFGRDVNAARYRDGVRETPNGPGEADAAALKVLHDQEGCTLQVHQPQRWDDESWRLLAALESKLGSLVGSNAYLTPPGTQGLAPHHDDVELWVLQTAGSKSWKCYAPLAGHELPSKSSGNLEQARRLGGLLLGGAAGRAANAGSVLGPPVLEAVLEEGDVLYLPRGTVHQASASVAAASAHLTISTYQGTSYGDLATHLLGSCLKAQHDDPDRCLPLAARRGPPPGLAAAHSLHRVLSAPAGAGPTPSVVSDLAAALRALADKLAAHPDMLTPAVHSFTADFWAHRLPPHPEQLAPQGPTPDMGDKIWCRAAPWCCLMPHNGPAAAESDSEDEEDEAEEDGEEEEAGEGGVNKEVAPGSKGEEEEEEGAVKLVTCLHNIRETHMIRGDDEDEEEDDEDDDEDEEGGSGDDEAGPSGSGDGEGAKEGAGGKKGGGAAKGKAGEGKGGGHEGCEAGCGHGHAHGNGGGKGDGEGGGSEGDGSDDDGSDDVQLQDLLAEGLGGDEEAPRGNGPEALPGMVFPGGDTLRALVAVLGADSPDKAVPIASLPLQHDAEKLHLAFALWAEGFAATVRGGSASGQEGKGKQKGEGGGAPAAKKAKK